MNERRITNLENDLRIARKELDNEKEECEKELSTLKMKLINQERDSELKLKEVELEARQITTQFNDIKLKCKQLKDDNERQNTELNQIKAELSNRDNEYEKRRSKLIAEYEKKMRVLEIEKGYSSERAMTNEGKIRLLLRQEQALCDKWRTDYYKMAKHYEGKDEA